MIVIAENPLVTPSPSPIKVTKSPDKRPRGRPLSAKAARIQEMVEELEQAERREKNKDVLDTGQVQHCVLCQDEIHRQDSSTDIVTLLNGNSLQAVTNSLEEIVPGKQLTLISSLGDKNKMSPPKINFQCIIHFRGI